MIAAYVRVSSHDQSTEAQRSEIEKWLALHAKEPVAWYEDQFTGTTMDRPGMNRLLTDMRAGRFSKIVIWRVDRLGRTNAGMASLFEELIRREVTLVSVRDGFDLFTPTGRLLASILASMAVFETEVRAERQRIGIERAKEKGKYKGGKPGRRKVRPNVIRSMKQRGLSNAEIARIKGISERSVGRYLKEQA